jgi:hypothetical protein
MHRKVISMRHKMAKAVRRELSSAMAFLNPDGSLGKRCTFYDRPGWRELGPAPRCHRYFTLIFFQKSSNGTDCRTFSVECERCGVLARAVILPSCVVIMSPASKPTDPLQKSLLPSVWMASRG